MPNAGRRDEAEGCFRAALARRPEYHEAHNHLGIVLRERGRLDEASACFRAALEQKPDFPEAHNNLGIVLRDAGALDEAAAAFERAIAQKPDSAEAHKNLGMALLARGVFSPGWREYEWRFQTPRMAKRRRDFFSIPQWRGEPAAGKTLFVHAEQGFGDTIQFCRYATLAAARGLRVILEVQKPLLRLLENSFPEVDRVIAQGAVFLADETIDFQCPMLSLPLAFGTELASIPAAEEGYLRADPTSIAGWENRLAGGGKKMRVGLVWAGSGALAVDRRSITPESLLAPLFDVPGVTFTSLQKHGPAGARKIPADRCHA